jgi:hypothetical protein
MKWKVLITIIFILIIIYLLLTSKYNQYIFYHLLSNKPKFKYGKIKNNNFILDKPIYIFMHVCNKGEWENVFNELITHIIDSGLYDVCTTIFIGCSCEVCDVSLMDIPKKYNKAILLEKKPNDTHENETINELIEFSKSNDGYILYLHTKGITNKSVNQIYWRHFMTTYNVDLWRVCVDLLQQGYYTVGCNYFLLYLHYHYSGNYWWTTTDYLKTLDYINKKNITNRYEAEFKLLKNYKKNKHINLGTEMWISYMPMNIGLYSKNQIDFKDNYRRHNYHKKYPEEIPIIIF